MTMISLRGRSLLLAMLLWCVTPPLVAAEEPPPAGALWVLTLEGPVGPASADYLVRGLADAGASGAGGVLLRINTPAGWTAPCAR